MKKLIYFIVFVSFINLNASGFTLVSKFINKAKVVSSNAESLKMYDDLKKAVRGFYRQDEITKKIADLDNSQRALYKKLLEQENMLLLMISKRISANKIEDAASAIHVYIKSLLKNFSQKELKLIYKAYFDEVSNLKSYDEVLNFLKNDLKTYRHSDEVAFNIIALNPGVKKGIINISRNDLDILFSNLDMHRYFSKNDLDFDFFMLMKHDALGFLWDPTYKTKAKTFYEFVVANPDFIRRYDLHDNKKFVRSLYFISEDLKFNDVQEFMPVVRGETERVILRFFSIEKRLKGDFKYYNSGIILNLAKEYIDFSKDFFTGLERMDDLTLHFMKETNTFKDKALFYKFSEILANDRVYKRYDKVINKSKLDPFSSFFALRKEEMHYHIINNIIEKNSVDNLVGKLDEVVLSL
jgi:hypothetical protein